MTLAGIPKKLSIKKITDQQQPILRTNQLTLTRQSQGSYRHYSLLMAILFFLIFPVFGQSIELSNLDGTNGFKINGEEYIDRSGISVSSIGDFNNDGFDDVIIGSNGNDANGVDASGASYIVFGSDQGLNTPLEVMNLDGINGIKINGEGEFNAAGQSVSGAGDVNDDGIDDVIIGAVGADPNGRNSGASYVVFGSNQRFNNPLELSSLNGANGFKINGEAIDDFSGFSMAAAGDVNHDGIGDVIIGAFSAVTNGKFTGASYVVFGSDQLISTPLELSSLDGSNGFKINGEAMGDELGASVSAAGDMNADGIDDVIIGADDADPNGNSSGASYIVFGSDQGFTSPLELSALNGTNGFKINGEAMGDEAGNSVSVAGDVNNDGIDDVIIGASGADPNGSQSGTSYVVFGTDQGFSSPVELSNLDGSNGFKINGEAAGNNAGISVATAGDVNDDGIDDVLVGAFFSNVNGIDSGASYVVFGSDQAFSSSLELANLNGTNGFRLNGEWAGDQSGGSVSAAGDVNADGIDDLIIGATGREVHSGASYIAYGRNQGFVIKPPLMLATLGDVNGNNTQDIASIEFDQFSKTVTASIKDAENGNLIQQFSFSAKVRPIAVEIMDDINANSAPEIVLLGRGSNRAEIRDSLSGAQLGTVNFNPDVTAVDLKIIADLNGNGIVELAMLGEDSPSLGPILVEVRDALTGSLIESINFTDNMTPKGLLVLPNINGKGGPEIGVLGEHDNPNKPDRVELRDLQTGKWVKNLTYGKLTVHQAHVVADLNNNGGVEVAVLRTTQNKVNVLTKDVLNKTAVSNIGYSPNYAPGQLLVVPDVNGNGISELAVFGKNPNNQTQKVQIKDAKTNHTIRNVFFNKALQPNDLVVIPDINANNSSEIVFLSTRANGNHRVLIKDSKTGSLITRLGFD